MGIAIKGPCYVYGDNNLVLINSSVPDSMLKKKNNSVAYHHTREGTSRDKLRCIYINTHGNPSDLQTKSLPYGEKQIKFCKMLLKHIYGFDEHVRNVISDDSYNNNEAAGAASMKLVRFLL